MSNRGLIPSAIAFALLVCGGPIHAQQSAPVDLTGVWSTNSIDTLYNPAWDLEGMLSCRCAAETYDYMRSLLDDPANDHLSAEDIIVALESHTEETVTDRLSDFGREYASAYDLADDPAIQCERFGAFRTIVHSDPISFEMHDDRIQIEGEDLSVDRTVYMDGRGHPDDGVKTSVGHSIGWWEGETLVIETVNMTANLVDDGLAIHNSDQARGVERYTLGPGGRNLDMTLTVYDPVMLSAPLTIRRPRVLTPDVELDRAPCDVISGQF